MPILSVADLLADEPSLTTVQQQSAGQLPSAAAGFGVFAKHQPPPPPTTTTADQRPTGMDVLPSSGTQTSVARTPSQPVGFPAASAVPTVAALSARRTIAASTSAVNSATARRQQQQQQQLPATSSRVSSGLSSSSAIIIDDNDEDEARSTRLATAPVPAAAVAAATSAAAAAPARPPSPQPAPAAVSAESVDPWLPSVRTEKAPIQPTVKSATPAAAAGTLASSSASASVPAPANRRLPAHLPRGSPSNSTPPPSSRTSVSTPLPPTAAAAAAAGQSTPVAPRRSRSAAGLGSNAGLKGVGSQAEKVEIRRLVHDCRDRLHVERQNRPPAVFLSNRPRTAFGPPFVAFVGQLGLPALQSEPAAVADEHDVGSAGQGAPSTAVTDAVVGAGAGPSFVVVDDEAEAIAYEARERRGDSTRPGSSSSSTAAQTGRTLRRPCTALALQDEADSSAMSDAFFLGLHRRYEAFERRLKVREREALRHGRYKLKERTELIRSMDSRSFANLVGSLPNMIDSNAEDVSSIGQDRTDRRLTEERSQTSLPSIEPEEVRTRMLEEAEELLVKYDLMLPSERARQAQSRRLEALDDDDESDSTPPPQAHAAATSSHTGAANGNIGFAHASSSSHTGASSNGRSASRLSLSSGASAAPASSVGWPGSAHFSSSASESARRHGSGTPTIKLRLGHLSLPMTPLAAGASVADPATTASGSGAARASRIRSASTSEDGRRASTADGQPRRITLRKSGSADGKRSRRSSIERRAGTSLAHAINADTDDEGASDAHRQAPPAAVYVPYVHVDYYIQPAERYSDRAALVQEANRRVPEILAADRRRLTEPQQQQQQQAGPVVAAFAQPTISLPPNKSAPTSNPSMEALSQPAVGLISPAVQPVELSAPSKLPAGPRPPTPPPPPLSFHAAVVPVPTAPSRKVRPGKAKAIVPAPVRAARHFLPWGVPPPRMLEFKSDFALDGELWTLPLAEREARRRAQAEDAASGTEPLPGHLGEAALIAGANDVEPMVVDDP